MGSVVILTDTPPAPQTTTPSHSTPGKSRPLRMRETLSGRCQSWQVLDTGAIRTPCDRKRVCTGNWLREKNPSLYRGLEPTSVLRPFFCFLLRWDLCRSFLAALVWAKAFFFPVLVHGLGRCARGKSIHHEFTQAHVFHAKRVRFF